MFGIKAKIDCTIVVENEQNEELVTALEFKTGKNKTKEYIGQVLLYCILN